VAFGSATQDIALDAYRIESADRAPGRAGRHLPDGLPPGDDLGRRRRAVDRRARRGGQHRAAYQHSAWQTAYLVMAASMLVGVVTVLLSPEPAHRELPPARNPPSGCRARWSSRLPTSSAATAGRPR
jgi:PAT family beta-lactamase induction signal transducer AmpG